MENNNNNNTNNKIYFLEKKNDRADLIAEQFNAPPFSLSKII